MDQVVLALVHVRKPSLLPDDVKLRRRNLPEEAAVMDAALTVHDALRRSLAHRHRQEALTGRGPAANALLRQSPPHPPAPAVLPGSGLNDHLSPVHGDEEEQGLWKSERAGSTLWGAFAGASGASFSKDMESSDDESSPHAFLPGKQGPWVLGGAGAPASALSEEEPAAAAFRTVSDVEALELENLRTQPAAARHKPVRKAKYAVTATPTVSGEGSAT